MCETQSVSSARRAEYRAMLLTRQGRGNNRRSTMVGKRPMNDQWNNGRGSEKNKNADFTVFLSFFRFGAFFKGALFPET